MAVFDTTGTDDSDLGCITLCPAICTSSWFGDSVTSNTSYTTTEFAGFSVLASYRADISRSRVFDCNVFVKKERCYAHSDS